MSGQSRHTQNDTSLLLKYSYIVPVERGIPESLETEWLVLVVYPKSAVLDLDWRLED